MAAHTIATFHSKRSAQVLVDRLRDQGIDAQMYNERPLQEYWFLSHPMASIRVLVDDEERDQAERALRSSGNEGLLHEAVVCPQCGSAEIEYPQITRRFLTPGLLAFVMALGLVPRAFYCTRCHYTWTLEEEKNRGNGRDASGGA